MIPGAVLAAPYLDPSINTIDPRIGVHIQALGTSAQAGRPRGRCLVASANVANVEAATVERVQRLDPYGSPIDSYYLQYTAAPGEANNLEIRLEPAGVTLHEMSRPLVAKGCDQIDASTAHWLSDDSLTVTLADGDDLARIVDTRPLPTNPEPDAPRGP